VQAQLCAGFATVSGAERSWHSNHGWLGQF